MFLLQLQLYVLTIIRVTLRRIHKPFACSRRSDSGERCEVKRSAKKLLFIAFFTSHCSPLSERLEQANKPLGESPHFVSLNIPFLVKGTKKVSFLIEANEPYTNQLYLQKSNRFVFTSAYIDTTVY